MAPQKPRCTFKECRSAAQRIVGDCGFCDGHFCAKHRLLEDHKCSGLEDVSTSPTRSSPFPASSGGSAEIDDDSAVQWWLVGLGEYLSDVGCLDSSSREKRRGGSSILTRDMSCSAKRSRTSATRPSSRPNERRSSGVYKKRRSSNPSSPRSVAAARRRSRWLRRNGFFDSSSTPRPSLRFAFTR